MREDLSAPYPGYGFGALDAFDGYVAYRLLDSDALAREIGDMRALIDATYRELHVTQDLGIGMMLWLSHFFPDEPWARVQRARCLATLDGMWCNAQYFCREPGARAHEIRVHELRRQHRPASRRRARRSCARVERIFRHYRSHDEYDREAITHVMACSSHFPGLLLADTLAEPISRDSPPD